MHLYILQSKDKLIASLKEGSIGDSAGEAHVSSAELEECRQERDMYRDELNQHRMTVESLRTEIQVREKTAACFYFAVTTFTCIY